MVSYEIPSSYKHTLAKLWYKNWEFDILISTIQPYSIKGCVTRKGKWAAAIISAILAVSFCTTSTEFCINAAFSGDSWPMFHHDTSHSGYSTGNSPMNSVNLLWTFTTMAAIVSSPAVTLGCVFIGCNDGAVYCLNSSNGELIWYYPTGCEVKSSPAIENRCVYIGSDDGNVYALNATNGIQIWKYTTNSEIRSSPAVVDGLVYIGSGDANVYALNASSGAKVWIYTIGRGVDSSPAVSDGVVYVASHDYFVYALNGSTGQELWRCHTGSTVSSPSVYHGYVYIGSYDGYVCGLNASTGAKIWEYQTENSVSSSPAVAYGCVYVGSEDNKVYCLNASNGKKIWQRSTGYWVRSSPAVADGNIYVGSEDYNIYCLNASTGAKKWSYATENFVDSSPAIVNSTLYVGSDDNHIYVFALCDSTVETIPSQSAKPLAWTTIAFDVIACTAGAIIIFAILLFIRSTKRAKRSAEANNSSDKKLPWFSEHSDAICILAILAFSTIFFINLGGGPLWAADEKTYSQWAFHMVKDGDYLTPWAFGNIFWIGKPPLIMWLISLGYQIFGVNNFATRLWSPVFGTLSLVLIFYLGKKLHNLYIGFLSALVLGTFTTFYVFARHAMTDVPFVFFILTSVYFLLLCEKREGTNTYAALGGLFFGLAFMTKQIVAFLIPLIVFFYFKAIGRDIRFLFTKRFVPFWGIGLLVFSPWVIYMSICFGLEFWQWFFVNDAIVRTVSPLEGHVGGYLYYFSYLVNKENLFWVLLLPFAVGLCVFNSVIRRLKEDILIVVWISIVLVLFTFAQTKLEWYILPAFPAFAIAISSFLYQLSKKVQQISKLQTNKARI